MLDRLIHKLVWKYTFVDEMVNRYESILDGYRAKAGYIKQLEAKIVLQEAQYLQTVAHYENLIEELKSKQGV